MAHDSLYETWLYRGGGGGGNSGAGIPGPLRTKTNIENQPQSLRLQPWNTKRDLHHLEHFFSLVDSTAAALVYYYNGDHGKNMTRLTAVIALSAIQMDNAWN